MATVVDHDNITMTLDEFGSADPKHWRPTLVKGTIHLPRKVNRVVPTPVAMALLNKPSADVAKRANKQGALTPDRPLDTDYSHLVGLSIGGSDVSGNIIPMYSRVNQGQWQRWEEEIRKLKEGDDIKARASAAKNNQQLPMEVASVEVSVEYQDTSSEIPKTISLKVLDENGKVHKNFGSIENKGLEPKQTARPFDQITPRLDKALKAAQKQVEKGWLLEDNGENFKLPATGIDRPYAALDWLFVEKELHTYIESQGIVNADKVKFGNGYDFHPWQRKLIFLINRCNNSGWLKSDQYNANGLAKDKHENLSEEAGDRQAQVDHLVPKGKNGCNAFSNAQVISRLVARQEG